MNATRESSPRFGRFWILLATTLSLACAFAMPRPVSAGEPGYYSGGRFIPLELSEDEFAVEFADHTQREEAVQRSRVGGVGVVEPLPWGGSSCAFAILRVSDASAATRARVRSVGEFQSVNRVYRSKPEGQPILSSGNIVLRFRDGVSADEQAKIFEDYKVTVVRAVAGLDNAFVVTPMPGAGDVELDTANALYRDSRVRYAHPDFRFPTIKRQATFGPDTFFSQQWHLENNGSQGGTVDADIDIQDAWRRTFGANIRVGQFDDACQVDHEDFENYFTDETNYIGISHDVLTNAQSPTAAMPNSAGDRHGTSTMGLICAAYLNNIGVRGVAPLAEFTASGGLGSGATAEQISSAFAFARNQGVDVHNNSWGFADATNPDVIVDAARTAFEEGRDELGMFIAFAAGNGKGMNPNDSEGVQVEGDEELATMPTVIGVGASNANDEISVYSNFGVEIDVLAPSNDQGVVGSTLPAIVTTDNMDSLVTIEPGYNDGGFSDNGDPNLADPNYTDNFGGTSASSAIVSGIAGLILALEPNYTATQVRNIIEHTCDKINPNAANYDGVTSRSLRYGYGRVNAGVAVEATFDGYFWPERVADVCVGSDCDPAVPDDTIRWVINDDLRTLGETDFGVATQSVLVVESDGPFDWAPEDGTSYIVGEQVATGVVVRANLLAELYTFTEGSETKYFGIYTVTNTGSRGLTYGFGVSVTSEGVVKDSGRTLDSNTVDIPTGRPSVTIDVNPLSGESPLLVSFNGNAQSDQAIASVLWDFGDGSTSTDLVTQHTYTVAAGTQRFFASLTVTDVDGDSGVATVALDVSAPGGGDNGNGSSGASVTIRISSPGSPDSDISSGFSPLSVVLTAELDGIGVTPDDLAVFWDLGDGNTDNALTVAHTYQIAGRFPISVQITSDSLDEPLRSTRFLDVFSNATPTPTPTATPDPGDGTGNGGSTICGAGILSAFWAGALLLVWRRLMR